MSDLTQDFRLTITVPHGMELHEAQELVLQNFPEQIGGVTIDFVRITSGLVDRDSVPTGPQIDRKDKR